MNKNCVKKIKARLWNEPNPDISPWHLLDQIQVPQCSLESSQQEVSQSQTKNKYCWILICLHKFVEITWDRKCSRIYFKVSYYSLKFDSSKRKSSLFRPFVFLSKDYSRHRSFVRDHGLGWRAFQNFAKREDQNTFLYNRSISRWYILQS